MTVVLDGESFNIETLYRISDKREKLDIAPSALMKVRNSRETLERISESGRNIYGVNTGFGSLLNQKIKPEDRIKLQVNLLRSHSSGIGAPLEETTVRSIMAIRLNSLIKGFSGVTEGLVLAIRDAINAGFYPFVPQFGSVGASGDLAPLSHIGLALTGEGEAFHNGSRRPASEVLKDLGLVPYRLREKEGVSFINGTSVISGILAVSLHESYRIFRNSIISACISLEALRATKTAFTSWAIEARNQPGQAIIAREIINIIGKSKNLRNPTEEKIQDAYSIRCIPQVYGAVLDTLNYCRDVLEREINSVTDNPLINGDEYVSVGNFHGEPVALVSDFCAIALTDLGNMIERRLARLTDTSLSGLPPFLTENSGLNSGYMIPQYAAAALCNRNKTLCFPSSSDSIPTCANQEDHVSMGTNAALKLSEIVENLDTLVAMEVLLAAQGAGFLKTEISGVVAEFIMQYRKSVPALGEDRPPYIDIENTKSFLLKHPASSISLEKSAD